MTEGIDYFGRGHWLAPIQQKISLQARRRMFLLWKAYIQAHKLTSKKILDVGSTPDQDWADSNCMVPWLSAEGELSLFSIEDISGLQKVFPQVTILPRRAPGEPLPAGDREFDSCICSAVIEHVGCFENQVAFIKECGRVSNSLMLTTPNRGHWLEFHTKLPLIHWLPRPTHRKILTSLGKLSWAQEETLRLMSAAELRKAAEMALGESFQFHVETIWSLGMPSNLVLLGHRR